MKPFKVVAILILAIIAVTSYHFYHKRYGRDWDQAAQQTIEGVVSHQADLLQDLYHLKNAPPQPDDIGMPVINDVKVEITKIEDDPRSVNFKTYHAHIVVEALPELFRNETSTAPLNPHAEGDYSFDATRDFWPAPLIFIPDAEQIHIQWRRG